MTIPFFWGGGRILRNVLSKWVVKERERREEKSVFGVVVLNYVKGMLRV